MGLRGRLRQRHWAEARQAAAKAEQAETDADASRYGALVPDLSKVNTDTLDLKGDNATMANALVFAALTDAATLVATKIGERVGDGVKSMHVLVTNEVNLVQGSTTYLNLTRELEQLKDQAYAVIKQPSKAFTAGLIGVGSALALGSALASAVPGALSLFAHHETLTRTAPKTDDLAAASAVADALIRGEIGEVKHDTFRIARQGAINHLTDELASKLPELQKVTDPDAKDAAEALAKLITAELAMLTAVPGRGTRSPLAIASMYELMMGYRGDFRGAAPITHVMLVKSQPGSVSELINRRFMAKDKVLITATMSITYMLIDITDSRILVAGTETATVEAHGFMADTIQLDARGPQGAPLVSSTVAVSR